jgi:hypothetical protein
LLSSSVSRRFPPGTWGWWISSESCQIVAAGISDQLNTTVIIVGAGKDGLPIILDTK